MSERLKGKVAVITGGTSGIGEATAEAFVAEGAKVVVAGRTEKKGEEIADRLGDGAIYQRTDVLVEDDIKATIDLAKDRFGRLDCLFNNAGGSDRGDLETVTKEDFDYTMNLLLGSVVFGIKHAAPIMKEQKAGCIINTSSIAAIRTGQGGHLYGAAKAAVTVFTKAVGIELGQYHIRVNSISPGAVATPIFWGGPKVASTMDDAENNRLMERWKGILAKAVPIRRSGLAADIAAAAVYLASDEGSYVTCHDLVVDGGRSHAFHESPELLAGTDGN